MKKHSNKGSISGVLIIFIFMFIFLVFIFIVNKSLIKEMEGIDEAPAFKQAKPVTIDKKQKKEYSGEIIRKSISDPSRKFVINVFYAGGDQIARYKTVHGDIYDFTGNVPDGTVKFYDKTSGAYGEERYKDNKRHGAYKEFYSNGHLRRESQYSSGKLITNKEYFSDGILRMEEDYSDAMWITDNKEVGKGKVYFRNGKLRYEWSLTNSEGGGFNRSYNQDGTVTSENFFDENGKLIEIK